MRTLQTIFLCILIHFFNNNIAKGIENRLFANQVSIDRNVIASGNSVDENLTTFSVLTSNSGVALGIRSFSSALEVVFPEVIPSDTEILIRLGFDEDIFNVLLGNSSSDELGNLILGNHTLEIQAKNNDDVIKNAISSRPEQFMEDDLFAFVDGDGNQFISITLSEPTDRIRFIDSTNSLLGFNVENSSTIFGVFARVDEPEESSFELVKSVSTTEVQPGAILTYQLRITNTGDDELDDLEVVDVLPEGTIFVSASDDGEFENGSVFWELDDLDPGDEEVLTLVVRVPEELEDGTVISNTATAMDEDGQEVTSNEVRVTVRAGDDDPTESLFELIKTASATEVQPGATITYQLRITNTGDDELDDLEVIDELPEGTTFISASDDGEFENGSVIWELDDLDPGEEEVLTLTVRVSEELEPGTVIINIATASDEDNQEVTSNEVLVTVVAADGDPDESSFEFVKTASATEVQPGTTLTYQLIITNTGNVELDDLEVVDELPEGTIFISASDDGKFENGSVFWELDDLDPGDEEVLTLVVRVSEELEPGTVISNTATATDEDNQDVTSNEVLVTVVAADGDPDESSFEIVKTASATEVQPGTTLTYQLIITNTGNVELDDLEVVDELPEGTTFISASDDGEFENGMIFWELNDLEPGEEKVLTLEVLVSEEQEAGTFISNIATAMDEDDQEVTSNEVRVTVRAGDDDPSESSFEFVKTASATEVQPGTTLTYQLIITNTGNVELDDLEVVDELPEGTTFISASDDGEFENGTIFWELNDLEPGEEKVLTLEVLVSEELEPGTVISNTATASDEEQEVTSNEVRVTVVVEEEPGEALLELEKSATTAEVEPGGTITYQLTLTNTGGVTATAIEVNDVLPEGTTFISATEDGELLDGAVTWELDELEPGVEKVLTLEVLVSEELEPGTVISNTATASDEEQEVTSNEVRVTVVVEEEPGEALLELEKSATAAEVEPGGTITYQLTLTNTGGVTAIAIEVNDVLPEGSTFNSASDDGELLDGAVTWELDELEPGVEKVLTLEVLVSKELEPGTVISNTATASDEEQEVTSNEVLVTVVVEEEPVEALLELEKSATAVEVEPGRTITYQLTLTNTGGVTATAIEVNDMLPEGTTFISASDDGELLDGAVTWELDELEPGVEKVLTLEVLVSEELEPGTVISNTATASNEEQEVTSNEVRVTVVVEVQLTTLEIIKTPNTLVSAPGEIINYDIIIYNRGQVSATNVLVVDSIPMGLMPIEASSDGVITENTVVWEIPFIAAQDSVVLNLEAMVTLELGSIINRALVSGENFSPESVVALPIVVNAVDLVLKKTVSAPRVVTGIDFKYTLSITNNFDFTVADIMVVDTIPDGVQFKNATPQSGEVNFNEQSRVLSWQIESMEPGDSLNLNIEVRALDAGEITNTAYVQITQASIATIIDRTSVTHEQIDFIITNVFTPNGDGINDTWQIRDLQTLFPANRIVIVNRYGVEVFRTENYQNDWDGGNLNKGTYFYQLTVIDEIMGEITFTGFVMIVK